MSDSNVTVPTGGLPNWMRPTTIEGAMQLAEMFAKSDFVPQAHKGKPGNILVAMQIAATRDVQLLSVLQNVAVINGRPCIWGDFALALCRRHPEFEDIEERIEEGNGTLAAVCTIKRRGQTPVVQRFSKADAQIAGLWGKSGPWTQYPTRMLTMRARSWAMRNAFPDALLGLSITEEAQDIPAEQSPSVEVRKSGVSAVRAALGITEDPVDASLPNPTPAEMPLDDAPVYGDPTDAPAPARPKPQPMQRTALQTRLAAEWKASGRSADEFEGFAQAVIGKPCADNDEERQRLIDALLSGGGA